MLRGALAALVTGVCTVLVVLAVSILPYLNPVWVSFEQGRAQALAWTGFSEATLATVTNEILADLVLGPPDFDVTLDGAPVLNERERSHMRDVRAVFVMLYAAAAASLVLLIVLAVVARARGALARAAMWRRLRGTGTAIAVVTVAGGAVAIMFFDTAFELFHRTFFPSGTYLFDPRTERLVQLFPEQFWVDTSIAVGATAIVIGLVLRRLGRRRAAQAERGR